jgi:5-carboxymethyl-2-hydroxymuconate isomerase
MTQPNPIELLEQLRTAKKVPEMANIVKQLLNASGIFNYQGIGQELARLSVTADGDGFRKQ